jgi:hypothetical protein
MSNQFLYRRREFIKLRPRKHRDLLASGAVASVALETRAVAELTRHCCRHLQCGSLHPKASAHRFPDVADHRLSSETPCAYRR